MTDQKPAFELELTRVIDAPRARVYEVWTKPEIERATQGAQQGWTMTLDQLAAFVKEE